MPTRPSPSAQRRRDVSRASSRRPAAAASFPIAGVGASAGGLDAFRELLAHVPADSGLALVLVQHLEATRASLLSDALAHATAMKVAQAQHGARVEPNHVYVIPPGAQMAIEQGVLKLSPLREDERRPHLPIDFFLQSLAADRGSGAIGVILSGNASDGTAGLAAVRARGGLTFAQDPRSARFEAMPQSAVDAGVVDFSLPLPALGAELARLAGHPYLARGPAAPPPDGAALVEQVLGVVRTATGVDFGEHKPATVMRRIARRMTVRNAPDLASYLDVLRRDAAEVRSLYDDLLIKVTSFFRDQGSFAELRAVAFPEILRHKPAGTPVRAWVVGCATGEEVYSLAISLAEHLGDGGGAHPVLVFGSDLSEKAIEVARAGLYPDAAVRGLGEERLRRFFVRCERGWRVHPSIRSMCIFVRHDVARDPPFGRLDLICCCNVLIYFGLALQRRVLATAHYSLRRPGYLLLGRSESVSGARWFKAVSKRSKLFLRRPGPSHLHLTPREGAYPDVRPAAGAGGRSAPADLDLARRVDDLILARYGPPGVVVDEHLQIVEFRGRTGPYLEAPAGEPQSQLLKMARAGLAAPLRVALAQARKTSAPARKERVPIEGDGAGRSCDLVVLPVKASDGSERGFVVLFEERPPERRDARARKPAKGRARGARRALEEELASAKEHLAVLLEEHGRGNDALASADDALLSSNEELQSLNEELVTAQEELQATNEELRTVNDELNGRNQDLQLVNADLLNLLEAVEIPILILDAERRIRRFTRRAGAFLGITPADVGRRITQVALPIQAPDLDRWIARSMEDAILVEGQVQDHADRWHRLQVRPHRAADGRTDGVVLSLVDVDELLHEVHGARRARDHARDVVDAVLRGSVSALRVQARELQPGQRDGRATLRADAALEAGTGGEARLVAELLDLSRITGGKLSLSVEELDWRSLVRAVVDAARPEAEARAVRLAIQGKDDPVLCRADPARLQQVVAILVANAVRFTPSGGRVDVRIDAVDGLARLVVSDSGRGIDPAFLPHVFEGLAREDPSAPGDPDLGLPIAHALVKLLGGTMQAGSPGRDLGSTFTVSIPRHLGAGAPAS